MKKFMKAAWILAASALAFSSCVEEQTLAPQDEQANMVTFNVATSNDETKTNLGADDVIRWNATGEDLTLVQIETSKNSVSEAVSTKTTIDADANTAIFEVSAASNTATDLVYYGIYPADGMGTAKNSANELRLVLPSAQTPGNAGEFRDLLISKKVGPRTQPASGETMNFSFARPVALVEMTLKGMNAGETLKSVTFSTTTANTWLAGRLKYNYSTDKVTEYGYESNQEQTITVDYTNYTYTTGTENKILFSSFPAVLDNFTVTATTDKTTYTKTVDLTQSTKTFEFALNRINAFSVNNMSRKESEIVVKDGFYAVLHNTGAGYRILANAIGKYSLEAVDYLYDGSGSISPKDSYVWKFKYDAGNKGYTIYNSDMQKNGYLNSFVNAGHTNSKVDTTPEYFTIVAKADGTYNIQNKDKKVLWCCMKGKEQDFTFDTKDDTKDEINAGSPLLIVPVKTPPEIKLSATEAQIGWEGALDQEITFTKNRYTTGDITVTADPKASEWLTAKLATGKDAIVYSVMDNTVQAPRTATITVSYKGLPDQTITINQDAAPAPGIHFEKTQFDVAYTGEEAGVVPFTRVNAAGAVTLTVNKEATWFLAEVSTTADEIQYIAEANTAQAPRTATVTVSVEGAEPKTLTFTQAAAPEPHIEIAQENLTLSVVAAGAEGTIPFTRVNAADEVTISVNPEAKWLTAMENLTKDGIDYVAEANTNAESRTATITVTYGEKLQGTIQVTQAAASATKTYTLTLTPQDFPDAYSGSITGKTAEASDGSKLDVNLSSIGVMKLQESKTKYSIQFRKQSKGETWLKGSIAEGTITSVDYVVSGTSFLTKDVQAQTFSLTNGSSATKLSSITIVIEK